jgi:pimeloyl-ACP methyl ester carboxylesterase
MGGWVNASAAVLAGSNVDAVVSISGGASSVGVSDAFDAYTSAGSSIDDATARARAYVGVQGYDPAADLARMTQPTLWVWGERDESNPTVIDLENVRRLADAGRPFTWIVVPGVGHEFTNPETGDFDGSWVESARRFIRGQR